MDVTADPNPLPGGVPAGGSASVAAPASTKPLLRLRGISKHFGAVQALYGVDLDLPADEGQMLWEGHQVHIRTPKDAASLGIETVYQDLALADNLDIVQNMFLGRERVSSVFLDEDGMERAAADTLAGLRVTTVRSIRQPVATLSGGQRQAVAVAKAVMWNSKLVMLDEPTAALGVAQTAMVLELIRRLKDHGLAVMVISHNLNDVFEVADRIAVLRLGRMVAEDWLSSFDRQSVVDFMTTGGSSRERLASEGTRGKD
jgi:ABC-type sugar transport system ATPase subunit